MKRFLFVLALVLAACGGGSGSGPTPPTPHPTATPTQYSVSIRWSGALASKTQSGRRRFMSLMPMDASVSGPVLLTAHSPYNLASNDAAVAQVVVSPAPLATPEASWTTTDTNVATTPDPNEAAAISVFAKSSSASTGQLNADLTVPVTATASANDYVYPHLLLECHHIAPAAPDNAPEGYVLQSGQLVESTDPTTADIYLDGPNCYGAFQNAAESDATIHLPGGAVLVSGYTPMNTITSAMFTGTPVTSLLLNSTDAAPAPYAVIFKDRTGAQTAKFVLEVIGNDYPDASIPASQQGTLDGPFCTFGSCVDGT